MNVMSRSEKAVAAVATWTFTRGQDKKDVWDAVESAMDALNYDGDAYVDELAEMVMHRATKRKHPSITSEENAERRALREAQRRMDAIASDAIGASTEERKGGKENERDRDDEDDEQTENDLWDPSPLPVNAEWLRTLDVIDNLSRKLDCAGSTAPT